MFRSVDGEGDDRQGYQQPTPAAQACPVSWFDVSFRFAKRHPVVGLLGLLLSLGSGCRSNRKVPEVIVPAVAVASVVTAPQVPASAPSLADSTGNVSPLHPDPPTTQVVPTTLMTLDVSAFHASIGVDDEAVYVLTTKAAYRIVPGEKPRTMPLELGFGAALTSTSIVYWSNGAVWRAPKAGGKPIRMGTVSERPDYFVASGKDFAWLGRSSETTLAIQTLDGPKARTVYSTAASIEAMTLLDSHAVFVERSAHAKWRFGSVPLSGGNPIFTAERSGRAPAMIAAAGDIFFYDGNGRDVRSLSPDLQHEETLAKDFICTPFAVAEKIYCSQMSDLFELSKSPLVTRALVQGQGQRSVVARMAVNAKRLAWLSDAGADKLAVMMLPLNQPDDNRK